MLRGLNCIIKCCCDNYLLGPFTLMLHCPFMYLGRGGFFFGWSAPRNPRVSKRQSSWKSGFHFTTGRNGYFNVFRVVESAKTYCWLLLTAMGDYNQLKPLFFRSPRESHMALPPGFGSEFILRSCSHSFIPFSCLSLLRMLATAVPISVHFTSTLICCSMMSSGVKCPRL